MNSNELSRGLNHIWSNQNTPDTMPNSSFHPPSKQFFLSRFQKNKVFDDFWGTQADRRTRALHKLPSYAGAMMYDEKTKATVQKIPLLTVKASLRGLGWKTRGFKPLEKP